MSAWRKIAGAFVDFSDKGGAPGGALSDDELEAELAKIRKDGGLDDDLEEEPETPSAPPLPEISGGIIAFVDKPLVEIYAQSNVPPSKRPVEMVLAFMQGLKALPFDARQAAVIAMDEADDTWEISDAVNDAVAKVAALNSAKDGLTAADTAAEEASVAEQAALDEYLASAKTEIERQIAELQTTLATETNEVNQKKAAIIGRRGAERDAVARGQIRFDEEVKRLAIIPTTFGPK